MAIDQTSLSPKPDLDQSSMIENEIPAYRAISPGAVASLLFGLTSVFCFAHFSFLLVAASAVVLGLLAVKKINKFPEILTGKGIALGGVALGGLFAVLSVTISVGNDVSTNMQGSDFAKKYIGVLKEDSLGMAVWLMQPPAYRVTKKPDDIIAEIKKASSPGKPDVFLEKTGAIQAIKRRIKEPGETIKFSKIEEKAYEGLTVYANALVELDGPGSKEFPEKEQFALIMMVKVPNGGRSDWYVKDVRFPYSPMSAGLDIPHKSDDGHGH